MGWWLFREAECFFGRETIFSEAVFRDAHGRCSGDFYAFTGSES